MVAWHAGLAFGVLWLFDTFLNSALERQTILYQSIRHSHCSSVTFSRHRELEFLRYARRTLAASGGQPLDASDDP